MWMQSSSEPEIDRAISELKHGSGRLQSWSIQRHLQVVEECCQGVAAVADSWVDAACEAKHIPVGSDARADEILAGPVAVLRYLQLLHHTLQAIRDHGQPKLPGPAKMVNGQLRVPVFPTHQLWDRIVFQPMSAETWLEPGVSADNWFDRSATEHAPQDPASRRVVLVLGAGNVSAIPATDSLTKIFQQRCAVLLKMNPVNEYLGPLFETAFRSLIAADVLRIVYGGAEIGQFVVSRDQIDEIHVTGSTATHDRIVWGTEADEQASRKAAGSPLLQKPITSELGNVTPWIVVPGKYSDRELDSQAQNIAASITNNASFNCVATKLILTCADWPQRNRLLELVDMALQQTPRRWAYYPGALERYAKFAGRPPEDPEYLPWTLRRQVDVAESPHLIREESFVCVAVESPLDAESPAEFLTKAVDFVNHQVWGTLAISLSVPQNFDRTRLDQALRELRYGTIGINQWSAVSYALMSPPWGGWPGATLQDVQSGIGHVHNTFFLSKPEKTVLRGPLHLIPKPVWSIKHRHPVRVASQLQRLYAQPSWSKLPSLLWSAMTG